MSLDILLIYRTILESTHQFTHTIPSLSMPQNDYIHIPESTLVPYSPISGTPRPGLRVVGPSTASVGYLGLCAFPNLRLIGTFVNHRNHKLLGCCPSPRKQSRCMSYRGQARKRAPGVHVNQTSYVPAILSVPMFEALALGSDRSGMGCVRSGPG